MLHTKFRENRPTSSGEEDFECFFFFTIYGHDGHLGHVTKILRSNFRFSLPMNAPHKISF